jgi:hypothetical protein
MEAGDNGERIEEADEQSADAERQLDELSSLRARIQSSTTLKIGPMIVMVSTTGDKNRDERCDKEIDDLRHMLVEPFLQKAHEQNGNDDRDDVALIAGLLNRETENMPGTGIDSPAVSCIEATFHAFTRFRMDHHDSR